ncbi:MAG: JAB domain-containing protein [Sediminibacterium sp.]|jgi:DNA repair protein RadC|uniref:JAB domain-containing protein n=1 Tax=unclassified Sediminibacterium TaxID=2635961 RepID=UPI001D9FDCBB|nr:MULTISPECIES: JAB domain-containing protein [unclassified Sediminibacterium]MBW0162408.1 JAB domain-containing protein [Sediminibacterium sp.]MBW0164616.1 JAB domain-containing protein [Sediminibacterium sp.]MDZ4071109.1 JAB domain-containing protein [Sediminibacterium sp.]
MKELTQSAAEIQVSYIPKKTLGNKISCSEDAYQLLKDFYPQETISLQERFVVAYLNRAHNVIGVYEASVGGLTGTIADPRLIVSVALKIAATSIILSHNHPSGNLNPSNTDQELTNKIREACKYLDINVLDHIIITPKTFYSFADSSK